MGAGSKAARAYWLKSLIAEMKATIERNEVAVLPALRSDGMSLADVAQHLGRRGLLVRQPTENGPAFVSDSLAGLGVKQKTEA